MINIHLIGNTVYDVTPYIEKGSVSWSENGDNEVQVDLKDTFAFSQNLFQSNYQYQCVVLDGGRQVFNGKLSNNSRVNAVSSLTAVGDFYKTQEIEDYTEFWSDTGASKFYIQDEDNSRIGAVSGELISQVVAAAPDVFSSDINDAYITLSLKKGAAYTSFSGIGAVYELPAIATNDMRYVGFQLDYVIPSGFLIVVQPRDSAGSAAINAFSTNPLVATSNTRVIYTTIPADTRYLYFAYRHNEASTYTNTQEDGYWYAKLSYIRMLHHGDDTITTTLNGAITPGSDKTITPASMDGINIGDLLYFNSGGTTNEVITVKSVSGSSFIADVRNNHANGETFYIPRMLATSVIEDIANRIGASVVFDTTPDKDIPNALYNNQDAFSILQDLKYTSLHNDILEIRAQDGNIIVTEHGSTPVYYANASDIQLSKEYDSLVAYVNSQYTTNAGIDRVTGSVSDTKSISLNSLRTRRIESNYTISGAALNDASQYLTANSRVTIKSDFKVTKLYNSAGGIVDYPIMGSQVIFRNLIPELLGIADYSYALKSATLDIVTGEKEYVIGEYLDTLPTLVANI